jgi:hypothetical protein
MCTRKAAITAGLLSTLLISSSANAEAALADLFIVIPEMLFLGVYLQIKKFFWLLAFLVALSWALQWMSRYYRDNAVHDPLQAEASLLAFHRFINGIGITAVLWVLLTHMIFGQEKLASLDTYMKQQNTPKPAPRAAEPPPLMNPFGGPWPDRMGYLQSAPFGARRGSTSVVISNSQSATPVYIKLCHYGVAACSGIRHAYIGANWYFRMEKVTPGEYELRFRQTTPHGKAAKSRKITVTGESATDEITWQIPLSPAHSGPPDMQFTAIDPAAF